MTICISFHSRKRPGGGRQGWELLILFYRQEIEAQRGLWLDSSHTANHVSSGWTRQESFPTKPEGLGNVGSWAYWQGKRKRGRQLNCPRRAGRHVSSQQPWCGWRLPSPAVGLLFQGIIPGHPLTRPSLPLECSKTGKIFRKIEDLEKWRQGWGCEVVRSVQEKA